MADYCAVARERMRNPYLRDETARVGREPLRKLAPDDRLVRPMTLALDHGINTDGYVTAIAAALHHSDPADPQSVEMQTLIAEKGVKAALAAITGLSADSALAARIATAYEMM